MVHRLIGLLLPGLTALAAGCATTTSFAADLAPQPFEFDPLVRRCLLRENEFVRGVQADPVQEYDRYSPGRTHYVLMLGIQQDPDPAHLASLLAKAERIPLEAARLALEAWTRCEFCRSPDAPDVAKATVRSADTALRMAPDSPFLLDLDAAARAVYSGGSGGNPPGYVEVLKSTRSPGEAALTAVLQVSGLGDQTARELLLLARSELPTHFVTQMLTAELGTATARDRAELYLTLGPCNPTIKNQPARSPYRTKTASPIPFN